MTDFRKILIANRGEIAIRIMRAANEMGKTTVAVFAEEDKLGLHRFKADEARFLIVDDVLTTGSTASECARMLRQKFDVEEIAVITVMRG